MSKSHAMRHLELSWSLRKSPKLYLEDAVELRKTFIGDRFTINDEDYAAASAECDRLWGNEVERMRAKGMFAERNGQILSSGKPQQPFFHPRSPGRPTHPKIIGGVIHCDEDTPLEELPF